MHARSRRPDCVAGDDGLFPPRRARTVCYLPVGDGHVLYVETSGATSGIPVLFLHGGPGSGCSARHRRLFDPRRFRVIMFDQRGCGRSRPLARVGTPLANNTTADLVADIETIRRHFAIDRWLVHGGSWGALLALAYACAHPARVAAMVLRGSFLGSTAEIVGYTSWLRRHAPDRWQEFLSATPGIAGLAADDALAESLRLLATTAGNRSEARRQRLAAQIWLAYESTLMGDLPAAAIALPPRQMAKALIQGHYLANACFVDATTLLAACVHLRDIPAVVVHGLADPVCPADSGMRICAAWPEAEWCPVAGAGHGMFEPAMARAVVAALDRAAGRCN